MHSAIVYAVIDGNSVEWRQKIGVLLSQIARIEEEKSLLRLGEFVWQVDFQQKPHALARLVVACEQQAIPYRILPLDAEPQWIRRDPK
jgi:hypothetical protein